MIPLSATALLGVTIAVVAGIVPVKEAFKSLGHLIVILFLGSFLIAVAMSKYGLDRRIALSLLSRPFFIKTPFRLIVGFSLIGAFLSFWISNTATTAILLPLSLGIISIMDRSSIQNADRFSTYLLLAISYSASIGGATTLVGTPTNLVGAGFLEKAGYNVDFLKWLLLALPITTTTYLAFLLYLRFNLKGVTYNPQEVGLLLQTERRQLPPMSRGEINTLIAFGLAVLLWILPGLLKLVGADTLYQFFKHHLPTSIVALIAGLLLFLLPTENGKGTLGVEDLREIDWDAILLFGGGLALGGLIIKTGLAKYIGVKIGHLISPDQLWLFIFILVIAMVFLTEISSNTATVLTFVPILIGVLEELKIDMFFPIFGIVIAASFAFMLPIATPPNAIVYGSRRVPITTMAKVGLFLNLIGAVIITGFTLLYLHTLGS